MDKKIGLCRLTPLLGTLVAFSFLAAGCGGKEDAAAQGGGNYVAGTEATRKGGGAVTATPPMKGTKGKTAPGAPAGEKSAVAPPSNTAQIQGGANLAL